MFFAFDLPSKSQFSLFLMDLIGDLAVGQNLRYRFGDDYPPKVVYFKASPGYRGFDPQPFGCWFISCFIIV